jgi:hypothetical protein
MNDRRLVGIDLGSATAHTVRVLDGEGSVVAKRKAWPTAESLAAVETAALAGCPAGTRLEVVIEPTGPAWLPIAVFFTARGHLHGRPGPVRHRQAVPLLHRPDPQRPPRPGKPTARASPCPKPGPRCCAPRWSAPPTPPASKTPSSPASTTSR